MYKIIIVDDEKWVRVGLSCILQELRGDIILAGEASDGEVALDLITEIKPDIVIADIKMPFMNGLELFSRAKELMPWIKFIMISGYSDFDYVIKAIDLGASAYILKPINEQNLNEKLQNAINEIEKERQMSDVSQKKRLLEMNYDYFMLERLVNEAIHSGTVNNQVFKFRLSDYLPQNDERIILAMVNIELTDAKNAGFTDSDGDMLRYAINNIIKDLCPRFLLDGQRVIALRNLRSTNQFFILMHDKDPAALTANSEKLFPELHRVIKSVLGVNLSISISAVYDSISDEMYKQCKTAYNRRFVLGNNGIYTFKRYELKIPEHIIKTFRTSLRSGDFQNAETIVKNLFQKDSIQKYSSGNIKPLYLLIGNIIISACSTAKVSMLQEMQDKLLSEDTLDMYDSSNHVAVFITSVIYAMMDNKSPGSVNITEIIGEIKSYVEINYAEDLSVKSLGKRFNLSPKYLSEVFKHETGMNLINYITNVRIEKACDLLRNTQTNIGEIARIAGYQDIQYFYRVFKKNVALTPSEYRSMHLKQ